MAKFIDESDLQASASALRISNILIGKCSGSQEGQTVVKKAIALAHSQLI